MPNLMYKVVLISFMMANKGCSMRKDVSYVMSEFTDEIENSSRIGIMHITLMECV